MSLQFIKMHGVGNDYVYVDCFQQAPPEHLADLARRIADRHTGVGGDGLILIGPSTVADVRMRMFNADGSEAEMCGNGIRCVAKYVYDHGIARNHLLKVETGRGVLMVEVFASGGSVDRVRVDMGPPMLAAAKIPTTLAGNPVVDVELPLGDQTVRVSSVSMGNPHCILFVEALTDQLVLGLGPRIETHESFPQRVNVEFVQILSPAEVRQRTWERGAGETMACGTGAAAVCVAGVLAGRTERDLLIHLAGGDLALQWREQDNHVMMTGPAEEVFTGQWPV